MNTVHVLDCTLRDGGYCNQWQFGFENTKKITEGLVKAEIDIIECGFLTNKIKYNADITKYNTVEEVAKVIPKERRGKMFVAMMNYGEYDVRQLPVCDGASIDGIRLAFHKKNLIEAIEVCKEIQEKGYSVFIQAMVSLSYSDEEFLSLIQMVNEFKPYAFYIVDSFGMMKSRDLTRLFYMVEHNLNENIWIGFHSHNNMQLAYSNAQALVGVKTNRNLIIDSSIYGMGRGAGNLNTELFIEYLNENYDKRYQLKPLLIIIDDILNSFYERNNWGYSLPNYISAKYNAHPNYAGYLDDKKTLTIGNMDEIFGMLEEDKKFSFDEEYIEAIYLKYMATDKAQEEHKEELINTLCAKRIILIAPGKSSVEQKDKIIDAAKKDNTIIISVNFEYPYTDTDYIFLSNLRRFRELEESKRSKCIVTSNIPAEGVYYQTKYKDLVNSYDKVQDNAGLMAVNFSIMYGASEILLAGFDGYAHDVKQNYADEQMVFAARGTVLDAMNEGMSTVLKEYSEIKKISFLTTPKYITL